jgi:phosphate-selective porin OprO/OprP
MKLTPRYLAVAVLAALAPAAHAEIAIDVIGPYEVSLEGLMQADGNWYHNDLLDLNAPATNNDGKDTEFEMRRSEVILKGKGTTFDWVLGYDGKANKFLDVNLKWKIGTNYLMAGQYKQPNSMEELSSTRFNDFVSKAMVTNLFGVARRTGVAYGDDPSPNFGYVVSYFGRELTRGLAQGQGWGARGYFAPMNDNGSILHFGLSAVDFDTHFDATRLRVRPDADLSTGRLVDTGNLTLADRQRTFGAEGLWVTGPIKVQAEYMRSRVKRYGGKPNFTGDSWYVSGLWNLSGETWGYKQGVPVTNLPDDPSAGMWQVGVRYDKTDLNDEPVFGGEEHNITLGVNWYIRSNFKLMFNYVDVHSSKFNAVQHKEIADDPNILETRLQFFW